MRDNEDMDEPIIGQKYVCVSFLSPEDENIDDSLQKTKQNYALRDFKIRGVFATKEEADEYAKCLSKATPDLDYHVVEIVDMDNE